MNVERSEWLLWQLIDSAFPAGGFAHSGGLEAARQAGEVVDSNQFAEFLRASLLQTGYGKLPFVESARREPARFSELDQFCHVFLSNHVANRASRVQGQAFLDAVGRIFDEPTLSELRKRVRRENWPAHLPVVFGTAFGCLAIPSMETARAFLFITLRDLLAAAVRLNIVGALRAQAIHRETAPLAEEMVAQCADIPLGEVAQTAPVLEVLQATQDRLYSRLFQS